LLGAGKGIEMKYSKELPKASHFPRKRGRWFSQFREKAQ
jgi:hypothetical protein